MNAIVPSLALGLIASACIPHTSTGFADWLLFRAKCVVITTSISLIGAAS